MDVIQVAIIITVITDMEENLGDVKKIIQEPHFHRIVTEIMTERGIVTEAETEIVTVVAEHQRWNRKTAKNKEKSEQAIAACSYHLAI